jgi:hypothetical protein
MSGLILETLLNILGLFVGPPKRPSRLHRAIAHVINTGSIWTRLGVLLLIVIGVVAATIGVLWGLLAGIVAIGEAIKG